MATQQSLRSQIAIVQQEPILFHRSLAENIAYGRPGASMAAIEQAARLANAHDFILRLPKGYGTLVGERGVKLSGGERQRVALARAFLADAPVLILDEATSSLDSESEALIQQAMERLMKGRTSIVIAHRLSTVRSLDRILVFDRGEIVEQGTHAALRGARRRHLSRAVRAAGDRVRPHLGGGVRHCCGPDRCRNIFPASRGLRDALVPEASASRTSGKLPAISRLAISTRRTRFARFALPPSRIAEAMAACWADADAETQASAAEAERYQAAVKRALEIASANLRRFDARHFGQPDHQTVRQGRPSEDRKGAASRHPVRKKPGRN